MNEEAEMWVLWSIIIDNLCLQNLEITEDDFYNPRFKIIFKCIKKLKKEWVDIDLITIKNILEKSKNLDRIGWIEQLTELTSMSLSHNFMSYQKIVKDYSIRKKLTKTLNDSTALLSNWIIDNNEIISDIYSKISKIEEWISDNTENIAELLEKTHWYIDDIKNKDLIWYSFWEELKFLDTISWWLERGKIYRIGWWSNVWKSWLMYNMLLNLLKNTDKITFFALENNNEFTMKNLLCCKKWVNPRNDLIKKQNYDFTEEYNYFMDKSNFMVTSKYRDLYDIFRVAVKNKSEFIFIDFIQIIEIPWAFKWETEKYNFYSKELQKFASKYNIWIVDLSQLSNSTQRDWLDWLWSTEFKGWWSLKESCDIWIHLFKDKNKEEMKEQSIRNWDMQEFNKTYLNILVSKNRLWPWVWNSHWYCLDFNRWGRYIKEID